MNNNKPMLALWADNALDLTGRNPVRVVDWVDLGLMTRGMENQCFCPPQPLPPQPYRRLPPESPVALQRLYNVAKTDLWWHGVDADALYLYMLYQSAELEPGQVLRGPQWHFDLTRLLQNREPPGHVPVAISYSASNVLPTMYATLRQEKPLPVRATIEDKSCHAALGEVAEREGRIFRPDAGEVVCYDNLVLHRGMPNGSDRPVRRAFMHLAFSPVP